MLFVGSIAIVRSTLSLQADFMVILSVFILQYCCFMARAELEKHLKLEKAPG